MAEDEAAGIVEYASIFVDVTNILTVKADVTVVVSNKTVCDGFFSNEAQADRALKIAAICSNVELGSRAEIVVEEEPGIYSRHVFCVKPPDYHNDEVLAKSQLEKCYSVCLEAAAELGALSIVFPNIDFRHLGIPDDVAAEIALNTTHNFCANNPFTFEKIFFALTEEEHKSFFYKIAEKSGFPK